ncbi:hypothetical protein GCM10018779_57910 [Streptomyces griseocarneus]|nr:hypothetical protein GCM10018779_57910 [Streptomyces griseocarneus]
MVEHPASGHRPPARVASERSNGTARNYRDLTVDGLHTYYVLAGAAPVLVHNCGTATVHKYELADGPHYTVEIRTGSGESFNTHAMDPGGILKPMPHTSSIAGTYRGAAEFDLPNPEAAIAYAKKAHRGSKGQGAYDRLTNNCITYCSRVIEAGGGEGPPTQIRGPVDQEELSSGRCGAVMVEHPSFTQMMVELLTWPKAMGYRPRELAGRIITYDVRITWWFSAVGDTSQSHSEGDLLDLLEALLEEHEKLETAWNAFKREALTPDDLVAAMQEVFGVVQGLVDDLPQSPWA